MPKQAVAESLIIVRVARSRRDNDCVHRFCGPLFVVFDAVISVRRDDCGKLAGDSADKVG